jgi:hypothetical protein
MAKAGGKTTKWILLSQAKAQAVEAHEEIVGTSHAPEFAEREIQKWLQSGQVCYRYRHFEGSSELLGHPKFFQDEPTASEASSLIQIKYVIIDWEKDSARRPGCRVYRIEIAKDDLTKLLPMAGVRDDDAATVTKVWITRKARDLKRAGKLDPLMKKNKFADHLAKLLKEEAKTNESLKAVKWKSISNKLNEWGLWPIDKI